MFGMGWQEILLILVVAVLVIGPDQIPQVARTLGKLIAQFRRVTNDLRDTVNRELQENESLKEFKEFQHSIDSEVRGIGFSAKEYVDREVAKGEAELKELDKEVLAEAGDPGPLTDPTPASDWAHTVGDYPAEESATPETAEVAVAEEGPAPAATAVRAEGQPPGEPPGEPPAGPSGAQPTDPDGDPPKADEAAARSGTRRETA